MSHPVPQWTHYSVKNLSNNGHTAVSHPVPQWTHYSVKNLSNNGHTAVSKTYPAMDMLLCRIDTDFDTLYGSIAISHWTLCQKVCQTDTFFHTIAVCCRIHLMSLLPSPVAKHRKPIYFQNVEQINNKTFQRN